MFGNFGSLQLELPALWFDGLQTRVGMENFWDKHGSVNLLVVLKDGEHRSSDSNSRTVERVNEVRFSGNAIPELGVQASRLEIGAV